MLVDYNSEFYIAYSSSRQSYWDFKLSPKAAWKFQNHCERYRKRYGLGILEYPLRGEIGAYAGITFTEGA